MGRIALLVAVVMLWGATRAAAAPTWTDLGALKAPIATDGDRTAVVQTVDGALTVLVDGRPVQRFEQTLGCTFGGQVGGGQALMQCPDERSNYSVFTPDPFLLDLSTGTLTKLPSPLGLGWPIAAVGSHWVAAWMSGNHYSVLRYVDHNNHVRTVDGPTVAPDLDATDVAQPLCAPVRRPPNTEGNFTDVAPPRAPALIAGHVVVFAKPTKGSARDEGVTAADLIAWRCGRPRPRVLEHCDENLCRGLMRGGSTVYVLQGGAVRAFNVATLRRRTLPAPPPTASLLAATRTSLFASQYSAYTPFTPHAYVLAGSN